MSSLLKTAIQFNSSLLLLSAIKMNLVKNYQTAFHIFVKPETKPFNI
jgi:hypothetical protein